MCLGLSLVSLVPGRARATLGGTLDSVESDRRTFLAAGRVTTDRGKFTVHEFSTGASTIREYVGSDGIVFAITWTGSRSPDLATLLGSYTDQYNEARANTARRPGARNSSIKADDVIVEKWGQVGNLQGRAYAPTLIPNGVSINEIQ